MVHYNMTIWLASGNKHKQQELAAILSGHTVKLPAEAGIKYFDPAETGASFAENALIKARALYLLLESAAGPKGQNSLTANLVLADDSGLCVDTLGGRPGIYSARYYGKNSWNSDGSFRDELNASAKLTDKERNLLLLEELNYTIPLNNLTKAQRHETCRFVCAMVLLFNSDHFYLVQETMEGEIVLSTAEIRGHGGFGYDPIVYLPEFGCTVAELSEEEKNHNSHRGKAGKIIAQLLAGN